MYEVMYSENAQATVSEEWLRELENSIYQRLDEKFTPSQRAVEQLEQGYDGEQALIHKELNYFTAQIMGLLYERMAYGQEKTRETIAG